MVDTVAAPETDYWKQQNEVNILHVSPFTIDDTITMRSKFKNKSTVDTFHPDTTRKGVSYDRYLD